MKWERFRTRCKDRVKSTSHGSGLLSHSGLLPLPLSHRANSVFCRLLFLALSGEPWGRQGSHRLAQELSAATATVSGVSLADVWGVLDIGPIVAPSQDNTGAAQVHAHVPPPAVAAAPEEMLQVLRARAEEGGSGVAVSVAEGVPSVSPAHSLLGGAALEGGVVSLSEGPGSIPYGGLGTAYEYACAGPCGTLPDGTLAAYGAFPATGGPPRVGPRRDWRGQRTLLRAEIAGLHDQPQRRRTCCQASLASVMRHPTRDALLFVALAVSPDFAAMGRVACLAARAVADLAVEAEAVPSVSCDGAEDVSRSALACLTLGARNSECQSLLGPLMDAVGGVPGSVAPLSYEFQASTIRSMGLDAYTQSPYQVRADASSHVPHALRLDGRTLSLHAPRKDASTRAEWERTR